MFIATKSLNLWRGSAVIDNKEAQRRGRRPMSACDLFIIVLELGIVLDEAWTVDLWPHWRSPRTQLVAKYRKEALNVLRVDGCRLVILIAG